MTNMNQTFQNAFRSENVDENGVTHDALSSLTRIVQDRQTWMGPSYAFKPSQSWGFGVSLFYARRSMYWQNDTRWQDELTVDEETLRTVFADIQSVTSVKDGRLLFRLGSSWRPSERLAVGIVVTSQSSSLHGDAKLTANELWSGDPEAPDDRLPFADSVVWRTLARTVSPWGFSLGFQYDWPGVMSIGVAADVWLPKSYTRIQLDGLDRDDREIVAEYVATTVERDLLLNGKIGFEFLTFDSFPVRLGLYTNRSAAP